MTLTVQSHVVGQTGNEQGHLLQRRGNLTESQPELVTAAWPRERCGIDATLARSRVRTQTKQFTMGGAFHIDFRYSNGVIWSIGQQHRGGEHGRYKCVIRHCMISLFLSFLLVDVLHEVTLLFLPSLSRRFPNAFLTPKCPMHNELAIHTGQANSGDGTRSLEAAV